MNLRAAVPADRASTRSPVRCVARKQPDLNARPSSRLRSCEHLVQPQTRSACDHELLREDVNVARVAVDSHRIGYTRASRVRHVSVGW